MKRIKIIYIGMVSMICFMHSFGWAQGDPSFRQNQFNPLMLNPAQAGGNSYSDISVLALNQWIGVPGSPRTFTVSGNFNLIKNFGIGVAVLGDEYGPVKMLKGEVNLAYHLKLSKKWTFSLGLRGALGNTSLRLGDLTVINPNDPYFQTNIQSGLNLNAGWGGLLYSKRFYLGFSQPKIVSTRFQGQDMTDFVDSHNGMIGYIGGDIPLSPSVDFRPNVVTRYVINTPFNLDVNAIFTIKKMVDLGASYQLNSGIGCILGIEISKRFYVGYSYSYPLTSLNKVSFQSHELGMRYKFNERVTKAQSPRFFMN